MYEEMLKRAKGGEFGTILAYSNSRLTRRPREYIDLIDLYRAHGVAIKTVISADVDLGTAEGRALGITVSAWDAAEADRTSERVKAAVASRRKSGAWHGGIPPYGYKLRSTKEPRQGLVKKRSEEELILEATALVLAGDSTYSIIKNWNLQGKKTRNGGLWMQANLVRHLSNRALLGENAGGKPGWEPILDVSTFDRLQIELGTPKRRPTERGVKGTTPTMGGKLTACGKCGYRLIGQPRNGRAGLRCASAMNGSGACNGVFVYHEPLEAYVYERVVARLNASGDDWEKEMARRPDDEKKALAALDAQRDDLNLQKRRVNDSHQRGMMDDDEQNERVTEIMAELENIGRKRNELLGLTASADVMAEGLDWDRWSPTRRRTFLQFFIEEVRINPWPAELPKATRRMAGESDGEFADRQAKHVRASIEGRTQIVWKQSAS